MGNVRELMARLGPSTVKFDTGRGGTPGLTNQDIAAALGMVPAGLGRELLEACWRPDGAALRRHKLRDAVIALVTPELRRQQRAERDRAAHRLGQLKAQCWPISTLESLPTLAAAVINEIAKRPHCSGCEGRGETMSGELRVICKACGGSGVVAVSDRRRAAALGRDESTYRAKWRGVYEWLLERM